MQWELVAASGLSAIVGGLIVAAVTHVLTRRREQSKLRVDKSMDPRIDAWRRIEALNGRDQPLEAIEKAVADVLLFGTEREIQLVTALAKQLGTKGVTDLTPILVELRHNIRADLGLPQSSVKHFFFRADAPKHGLEPYRLPPS
jgi:hypothetical protein